MTLDEAKALLTENNISFELRKYENETAYWRHTALFPYTKNARPCKVTAIVIRSNNLKKDIELQFNSVDDVFCFEELRFGDYCFEMFDYNEKMLTDDLLNHIYEIKDGSFVVIVANDIKKRCWIGDACFDLNDDDDAFGKPGFQKAMQRIRKPKGFFSVLLKSKKQYEIFDWNTYQVVVK